MTQTKSDTHIIKTCRTAMGALAVGAFALGAAAIGALAVVHWRSGVCESWKLALRSSPSVLSQWTI
jgi:hypothetical protein